MPEEDTPPQILVIDDDPSIRTCPISVGVKGV